MVRSLARSALVVALASFVFPTAPLDASARGFAPASAAQQSAPLTGIVRSTDDGSPVFGATVRLDGSTGAVFTDASGRFRLADVPPGDHTLIVSHPGFASGRIEVSVPGSGRAVGPVEIRLTPEAILVPGLVVTATGELRRRMETPASISRIDGASIRAEAPTHPARILNRVPGVWVSPTSTEGHMTAIRQPITTNPVYLFLEDGIPTRSPGFFNHNALYEVNVPHADRIEVIRGSGTALFGSDAIAGVIDVGTRPPSQDFAADTRVEVGSSGFRRALVSVSGRRGDDGLRFDLNVTDGDRWRQHARYDRQSATLRWDRTLDSGLQLRTTATWSHVHQQEPSVVSREQLDEDPSFNRHPITFRTVDALRVAVHAEHRLDRTFVQVTPFGRWNSLDLMPSWMLDFDPVVYETGHASFGLMARVHRDLRLPVPTRLTVGIDLDRSPGRRVEHRIAVVRDGGLAVDWNRGERLYDYRATYSGVSPYLQLAVQPIERLHVTAGLRRDDASFAYRTRLEPTQAGRHRRPANTTVRYGHFGPSLGAALTLLPELNLFASYRESFRAPSEGQLFRQGAAESTVELEPVRAVSAEAGVRGEAGTRVAYELVAYQLDVRDEILSFIRPDDGLRESLNAGRTRHRGLEAGLTVSPGGGVEADVSMSRASHRYVEWSPRTDLSYSGNRIEQAPRDLGSARLRGPLLASGGTFELEWVHMGRMWTDPANEHEYEGHALWNVRVEQPLPYGLSLSARLLNLTDRTFAERASYHPVRGAEFSPGRPRSALVGLRYQWR